MQIVFLLSVILLPYAQQGSSVKKQQVETFDWL